MAAARILVRVSIRPVTESDPRGKEKDAQERREASAENRELASVHESSLVRPESVKGPPNTEISSEDRAILAVAGFVCFISLFCGAPKMLPCDDRSKGPSEAAPQELDAGPRAFLVTPTRRPA
jgi:hypothetical protein